MDFKPNDLRTRQIKLAILGDKSFQDIKRLEKAIKTFLKNNRNTEIERILTRSSSLGADRLAFLYAKDNNIKTNRYKLGTKKETFEENRDLRDLSILKDCDYVMIFMLRDSKDNDRIFKFLKKLKKPNEIHFFA